MANTRNNPLEDLAIHLPMICDRYELRDDVLPGAGRYRGGIGVVKSQRVLTDAFITHENERHHDVPWGIFGGGPGATGKVEIYNVSDPDNIQDMPAKFSGIKINAGDVHAFYAPCGGGYGDPLERPASQVLEDVLDDFCTVEHARKAYGVVVDLTTETVDESATESLRTQMRSQPLATTSAPERKVQQVARETPAQRDRVGARVSEPVQPAKSLEADQTVASTISQLRGTFGDNWSFDIVYHTSNRSLTEVRGELRANGAYASETGTHEHAGAGYSAGKRLQTAAEQSFVKCAQKLLQND
jgi:hypothetical protein